MSVYQHTAQREEVTRSHSHVCPSPSVTAPVGHPPLLAVITGGIGHFHTARASSGLTPLSCTPSRWPTQYGSKARFTPRRAHIRARFPTLLLSGCGHAAAVNEAANRRRPSPALAALHPTRLPKRPRVIFQLRALQPSDCHPCRHWHLLLDHGLGPPPAH